MLHYSVERFQEAFHRFFYATNKQHVNFQAAGLIMLRLNYVLKKGMQTIRNNCMLLFVHIRQSSQNITKAFR